MTSKKQILDKIDEIAKRVRDDLKEIEDLAERYHKAGDEAYTPWEVKPKSWPLPPKSYTYDIMMQRSDEIKRGARSVLERVTKEHGLPDINTLCSAIDKAKSKRLKRQKI